MSEKSFSLSDKMRQLEEIEQFFQQPNLDIENALTKQKEAQALAKEILAYLKKVENSLQEIELASNTEIITNESL